MVDKALKGEASPLEACVAARNASAFEWLAFCQSFRVDHACIIPYFSHFSPRTTAGFTAFMEKQSVDWKSLIGSLQHSSAAKLGVLCTFTNIMLKGRSTIKVFGATERRLNLKQWQKAVIVTTRMEGSHEIPELI